MAAIDMLCKCKRQQIFVVEGKITDPCPMCGRKYKGVYREETLSIHGEEIRQPEKVVLKKDIIIPAGTIFSEAPSVTRRIGDGHYMADIGLNKDSAGSFCIQIDDCKEYFS